MTYTLSLSYGKDSHRLLPRFRRGCVGGLCGGFDIHRDENGGREINDSFVLW